MRVHTTGLLYTATWTRCSMFRVFSKQFLNASQRRQSVWKCKNWDGTGVSRWKLAAKSRRIVAPRRIWIVERRRRGDGQSLEKKKEEEKKGKKIGEKKYFSFSNRLRYKVQKKKKIYIYISKKREEKSIDRLRIVPIL